MKKCAVVISAYNCARFMQDLMDGLNSQKKTPGWIYDIRIGVDACKDTSYWLKMRKIKHYMAVENVGHLILRNALIYLSPADAYAYFDADDKMMPEYLYYNLKDIYRLNFVMAAKYNTYPDLRIKGAPVIQNGGAMTFSDRVLRAVGGFPPYRCAGDTDLMRRAEMAGFKIHKIQKALYLRRAHPAMLTKAKPTGIGSDYRKKAWAEMTALRNKGVIRIEPKKVKLMEVG